MSLPVSPNPRSFGFPGLHKLRKLLPDPVFQWLDQLRQQVQDDHSALAATILQNQTGGLAANLPAAGIPYRTYYATDTKVFYIDDGTAWQAINVGSPLPNVVTKLAGSMSGADYTTTSTNFTLVDGTNLSKSITATTKQTLVIHCNGTFTSTSGGGGTSFVTVGLGKDGTIVAQVDGIPQASGDTEPFGLTYSEPGDGLAHTWALYFLTGNASDTAHIHNNTNGDTPIIVIEQLGTA